MAANTLTIGLIITFVVLFSGIGILLILVHLRNKKKAVESMSWSETTGTVKKSSVEVGESVFGSDDAQDESQPMYSPEISYTYRVGDMVYTSDRISFAGKSSYSKPEKAEAMIADYPVGATVSVFYNPEKHELAVLNRSAKGSGILLAVGIGFLVIGVISLIVGIVIIL